MSEYRINVIEVEHHKSIKLIKFDNKEDAEHYAKNQSLTDKGHVYEVQKNNEGDFFKIKSYLDGQQI